MLTDRIKIYLIKFMCIGRSIQTDNRHWRIEVVRSVFPGHLSGWLINNRTGNKYIFSIVNNRVHYMREYKPPTNIPRYVNDFLINLKESLCSKS